MTETIAYAGWAAYAALWITGAVNLVAAGDVLRDNAYGRVALVKIAAVILSGVAGRATLLASGECVRRRAYLAGLCHINRQSYRAGPTQRPPGLRQTYAARGYPTRGETQAATKPRRHAATAGARRPTRPRRQRRQ